MFFSELRESILNAYKINNTLTIQIFVENLDTRAGKKQRELLVSAINYCNILIKNKDMIIEVSSYNENIARRIINLLTYDKDFRVFLPLLSEAPNLILKNKEATTIVNNNSNDTITKLCALYNILKQDLAKFSNGILYIFTKYKLHEIYENDIIYLFDILKKYKKMDNECADFIKNIALKNAKKPSTTKRCFDDTLLEECDCDELYLCGKEKICPVNLQYSNIDDCHKIKQTGGGNYFGKYLKYKQKYLQLLK